MDLQAVLQSTRDTLAEGERTIRRLHTSARAAQATVEHSRRLVRASRDAVRGASLRLGDEFYRVAAATESSPAEEDVTTTPADDGRDPVAPRNGVTQI